MMMHEIEFLKETLSAQQELLQKLYHELDVERESSATAADETLSMILRLQGEKAALEMEASQYKRIAEEKMFYAQETLDIFEELMYQKETQIASLEFQVQSYKFKLASLGYDDVVSCDMNYPEKVENMTSSQGSIRTFRRVNSLPPPVSDALSRRASSEGAMTETFSPRERGDYRLYWDEIKKLDERVKEFTVSNKGTNDSSGTSLSNSAESISSLHDPSPDKSDFHECLEKVVNVEVCGESQCSTSVHDIFEVPQCSDDVNLDWETRNEKLDSMWHGLWKSDFNEDIDQEKQPFLYPEHDRILPDIKVEKEIGPEKKRLLSWGGYGVADFELERLNRRLKELEGERFVSRGHNGTRDEETKVLREMMEKVEAMQSEIMTWRSKKRHPPEDRSFGCFKEVLFCFLP